MVHATREAFNNANTEVVLLVDASNAFNSPNRQVALLNIRHLCPSIATALINTYRDPSSLFVDGCRKKVPHRGILLPCQCMQLIGAIPIIRSLPKNVKQAWYADDASASGSVCNLRAWWDDPVSMGPAYGYHANAIKTWLITKDQHHQSAVSAFSGTKPHLGAALGTQGMHKPK